jgi:hypothetical protein
MMDKFTNAVILSVNTCQNPLDSTDNEAQRCVYKSLSNFLIIKHDIDDGNISFLPYPTLQHSG